jgi:hypothetical protein
LRSGSGGEESVDVPLVADSGLINFASAAVIARGDALCSSALNTTPTQ